MQISQFLWNNNLSNKNITIHYCWDTVCISVCAIFSLSKLDAMLIKQRMVCNHK